MEKQQPYFPLFFDLSDQSIVVVGGGKVAERRINTLRPFVGTITVIAPEMTENLKVCAQNGDIVWMQKKYEKADEPILRRARLVLAATDDLQCNAQVAETCHNYGIWVNASHKKELCDFYFPGVVSAEHIVVGVTASGKDHAQAKEVREKIKSLLKQEG